MLSSLALIVLFGIVFYAWLCKTPPNYPPGPKRWFLLGSMPFFSQWDPKYHFRALANVAKAYGPVVGLTLGHRRFVSVCGYHAVREVLNNECLTYRPESFIFNIRTKGQRLGLLMTHGDLWKEQRRFCLSHLKNLGFGRSSLEALMQDEIRDLLADMTTQAEQQKGVLELNKVFSVSILNILWAMVAGKRFDRHDQQLHRLLELMETFFRATNGLNNPLTFVPFLRYIAPEKTGYNRIKSFTVNVRNFITDIIEDHRKNPSDPDDPGDLIDVYLTELEVRQGESNSSFSEEQLYGIVFDLFSAGAETTSNSLSFALLYMLLYPEVQEKVFEEIEMVCGTGRFPQLSDRPRMPYTEATLNEVHRVASVAPLTIPHVAREDTAIMQYGIEKGTVVLVNLWSVHMDETYWEDPYRFDPTRHLTNEGKCRKDDHLLPFGLGKRSCMGEALAKSSMFLFFTSVIQKFRLKLCEDFPPSPEPLNGLSLAPAPFKGYIIPRY